MIAEPMQVYMPPLLLMLIIASATLTFCVGLVAGRGAKDGLSLWAWGLAVNTLALVLLGLRGHVADGLSIVGGNVALAGVYALFLAALGRLQNRRIPALWLCLPPLSIAGAFALLLADTQARVVISCVVSLAQQAIILRQLTATRWATGGRGKHLLLCALSIMIATLCCRFVVVAAGAVVIADITQDSAVQVLLFVASFIAQLLATIGYLLMARELADERFRLMAQKDTLTGVWNRAHLQEVAQQEMTRHARYAHPLALVMVDIDYFKNINDRFGHAAGDAVLQEFSRVVQRCIRSTDVLGRWGGEEFLLVSPDSALTDAVELAERVRGDLARHDFAEVGKVTASFGVAVYRKDETWARWLHRADMALYRAKATGRNRVLSEDAAEGEAFAARQALDGPGALPAPRPRSLDRCLQDLAACPTAHLAPDAEERL